MYYPLYSKNNTSYNLTPSFRRFTFMIVQYVEIIYCRCCYLITLCILAHTFYICISSNKFCPLKLFIYCEFALRDLTDAFCVNRPFTRIRMNFIASAHNTYLFFILQRVYGISRFLKKELQQYLIAKALELTQIHFLLYFLSVLLSLKDHLLILYNFCMLHKHQYFQYSCPRILFQ